MFDAGELQDVENSIKPLRRLFFFSPHPSWRWTDGASPR